MAPDGRGAVDVRKRTRMEQPKGGYQPWFLADPRLLVIAEKIQHGHRPLGQLSSRISAGIATGRDKIFVISREIGKDLEPELLRPCIRGKDISRYRAHDAGLQIIMPYLPSGQNRPELIDLADFPKARAYLEEHRKELEARHCVRTWQKTWYDIHDPWTLDVTRVTKILVPDVARSNRFALDTDGFCPLHSAYYILPKGVDPTYLTAVLNSSPIEFLVRLYAPVVKDGFSRYRRQFLVGLPIPSTSTAMRQEIVQASEALDHPKVDRLCCQLFGLSSRDLGAIRQFLDRVYSVH